ncbi:MAG: pantetheine-phosphate adenylyltransferase [Paludibacteraceae bacterium]|nr:pantetheine-phosphate adenylyltransferase [Paludibacteraceae bacterium]
MRVALFPGSFDPFTRGHQAIVERALPMFDKLVIAIGVNRAKKGWMPVEERLERLRELYANESRVEVVTYETLTMDLAAEYGAKYILRGVRSVTDFEYERTIADANRRIAGLETIFLISDAETSHISSSLVRELASFGRDISDLLP